MSRYPFPSAPNGWFGVAASEDVAVGDVRAVAYLGRELEQATVEEITMLQGLVTSIVEGHVSWKEVVRSREEARDADAEPATTATPPPATGRKKAADAVDAATK